MSEAVRKDNQWLECLVVLAIVIAGVWNLFAAKAVALNWRTFQHFMECWVLFAAGVVIAKVFRAPLRWRVVLPLVAISIWLAVINLFVAASISNSV
jgi:hypothetical protein